jgi:hypothetical protein
MKNPGVYRGSKYIDIAIIWPNCFYVAIFERKNLNCSADWKKNHFSEWFWYCNKLIVLIIWQLHVSFLSLWFYHDICFVSSFFSLPFIWFCCLVLWCLTPLSTIFQLYRGGQFYWWRKPEIPGENHRPATSHWQTLALNVVHLAMSGIRTHDINGDRHRLYR